VFAAFDQFVTEGFCLKMTVLAIGRQRFVQMPGNQQYEEKLSENVL